MQAHNACPVSVATSAATPDTIACSALKRRFNYSRHTGGRMTLAEAVIRTVIRRAKLHPFDAIKLNRAVKL